MTDTMVQEKCKELVHRINSDCVIGGGGPGMYLDGDGIYVLIYKAMNDIIDSIERPVFPETIYLPCESEGEQKPKGRPVGSKNKVVV